LLPLRSLRLPWGSLLASLSALPLLSCRWADTDEGGGHTRNTAGSYTGGGEQLILLLEAPALHHGGQGPPWPYGAPAQGLPEGLRLHYGFRGQPTQGQDEIPQGGGAGGPQVPQGGAVLHLSVGRGGVLNAQCYRCAGFALYSNTNHY